MNPLRGVKKLAEPDGRLRYLDADEIERLVAVCPLIYTLSWSVPFTPACGGARFSG